eukprot:scaffold5295_cov28-Tisochrysis_lutea.AAC.1
MSRTDAHNNMNIRNPFVSFPATVRGVRSSPRTTSRIILRSGASSSSHKKRGWNPFASSEKLPLDVAQHLKPAIATAVFSEHGCELPTPQPARCAEWWRERSRIVRRILESAPHKEPIRCE